jgi:hypothetical protein
MAQARSLPSPPQCGRAAAPGDRMGRRALSRLRQNAAGARSPCHGSLAPPQRVQPCLDSASPLSPQPGAWSSRCANRGESQGWRAYSKRVVFPLHPGSGGEQQTGDERTGSGDPVWRQAALPPAERHGRPRRNLVGILLVSPLAQALCLHTMSAAQVERTTAVSELSGGIAAP